MLRLIAFVVIGAHATEQCKGDATQLLGLRTKLSRATKNFDVLDSEVEVQTRVDLLAKRVKAVKSELSCENHETARLIQLICGSLHTSTEVLCTVGGIKSVCDVADNMKNLCAVGDALDQTGNVLEAGGGEVALTSVGVDHECEKLLTVEQEQKQTCVALAQTLTTSKHQLATPSTWMQCSGLSELFTRMETGTEQYVQDIQSVTCGGSLLLAQMQHQTRVQELLAMEQKLGEIEQGYRKLSEEHLKFVRQAKDDCESMRQSCSPLSYFKSACVDPANQILECHSKR